MFVTYAASYLTVDICICVFFVTIVPHGFRVSSTELLSN
jgi:hypothetical protein